MVSTRWLGIVFSAVLASCGAEVLMSDPAEAEQGSGGGGSSETDGGGSCQCATAEPLTLTGACSVQADDGVANNLEWWAVFDLPGVDPSRLVSAHAVVTTSAADAPFPDGFSGPTTQRRSTILLDGHRLAVHCGLDVDGSASKVAHVVIW